MTITVADRHLIQLAGRVIKSDNGPVGELKAVVNTGHQDHQGDVILPNAWRKVISEGQRPPIFWNHNYTNLALGSVVGLQELQPGDPRIPTFDGQMAGGLMARMQFALGTQAGHDAYVLASEGHIKEFSVAITNRKEDESTNYQGVRTVKLVHELIEISLVPKGASIGTHTLEAKAAYARMGVPAWLTGVAELAEDQTILAIQEAERYRHRRENEREAIREGARAGLAIAAKSLNEMIDRAMEVKEIERMSGQLGNFSVARPSRPLSAEQARIKEIRRMAGHVSS